VDWFYKLDTQSETRDFEYRFGGRSQRDPLRGTLYSSRDIYNIFANSDRDSED